MDKFRLQKLAGIKLDEVKRVNNTVKITNKKYKPLLPNHNEFFHRNCYFEFGGISDFYRKTVKEVMYDFNEGNISFATDYIKSRHVNDKDLEVWEEVKTYLGNEYYTVLESMDVFVQYLPENDQILFWGGLIPANDEYEGENNRFSEFDKNGNIVFEPQYFDEEVI